MSLRVGLFGGTFDPVHRGHLSIAESFLNSARIDELWVLLTPFPPHKQQEGHAKYGIRHSMLLAAFQDVGKTRILTIENDLPKPSYTYNTIRHLKEMHPAHEFLFCMGEDSLVQFHNWKFYQGILKEAGLLVAERPGADHSLVGEGILERTFFVEHEPLEISSSMVKEHIRESKPVTDLVPAGVADIIAKENLYR